MSASILPAVGLLICAAAALGLARAIRTGRLPRNGVIGIRTRRTTASDAAWEAAHDAARPVLRTAGLLWLVFGVLLLVIGLEDDAYGLPPMVLVVVFYLLVLLQTLRITLTADRAARRTLESSAT